MKVKRILAGVLSAAMVLACTPISNLSVAAAGETTDGGSFTATINEDEQSITYSNIDLTDPTSYDVSSTADFFTSTSAYSSIAFDIVLKYNSVDDLAVSTTADALITLADDSNNYLTVRYTPQYTSGKAVLVTSCSGINCGGSGYQSTNLNIGDTEYHKFSVAISGERVYTEGGGNSLAQAGNFGNNRVSGSPVFNTGGWTPTKVYIGKTAVSMGLTDSFNASGIENLPETATIAYIKVTKNLNPVASTSNDTGVSTYSSVSSVSTEALEAAKADVRAKMEGINQADYTVESWNSLTDALEAAGATTDAAIWNAIDAMHEAFEGLDTDSTSSKAELAALISHAEPLVSGLENNTYISGITGDKGLKEVLKAAKEVNANEASTTYQISQAASDLRKAIDDMTATYYGIKLNDSTSCDVSDTALFYKSDDSYQTSNLLVNVTLKYNSSALSAANTNGRYALFTLADDEGNYLTLWHNPWAMTSNNESKGQISFDYYGANGNSGSGIYWSRTDYYVGNADTYYEFSIAIDPECYYTTFSTGAGNISYSFANAPIFSSWEPTKVYIGQSVSSLGINTGHSNMVASSAFDGEIAYLSVSRNAVLTTASNTANIGYSDVQPITATKLSDANNLKKSAYKATSWSAYSDALAIANEAENDAAIWNALETAAANLVEAEHFTGSSVTLDGNIGLNFYADQTADDGVTVEFTKEDGTKVSATTPKEYTMEDGTTGLYYTFELPAKEMADKVTATMYDSDGDKISELEWSVKDYAEKLLGLGEYSADGALTQSETEKTLVKAMLNYGAAAQTKFNHNAGNLANYNLEDADKNVEAIGNELDAMCSNQGLADDSYTGFSLILKSETTLKLYFKAGTAVTVRDADGNEVATETGTSGDEVYYKIKNIKANDLGDAYTVSVGTGDTASDIGTVSALTYCYKAKSSTDEALVKTVDALYRYYKAAIAYKESLPTSPEQATE